MDDIKAKELLHKYASGSCTDEEKNIFEGWFTQLNSADRIRLTEVELDQAEQEMLARLSVEILEKRKNLWPYAAVAAAIICALSLAILFYNSKPQPITHNAKTISGNDILPGNNKAILTLADGSKISLTDASKGELTRQEGVSITKTKDGQLVYQVNNQSVGNKTGYNTVETPRGGQHQIVLPDGSKVWLNASSSLKFPSCFSKATQRKVVLKGEGYFEIAQMGRKIPFIVATEDQEVEVLGTHFNINSYADELVTKTTLLEGAVRLTPSGDKAVSVKSYLLRPGEQAIAGKGNTVSILNVDVNDAVDWKNGLFVFHKESLESIMRKLSRWYDVDVVFEDEGLKKQLFGGRVSRFSTVSEVLDVLALTDLAHFKIVGRRIMVVK